MKYLQQCALKSMLSQEGYAQGVVAARMGVSVSAVCKTLARTAEKADYSNRIRSGRPKVTAIQGDNDTPICYGPSICVFS